MVSIKKDHYLKSPFFYTKVYTSEETLPYCLICDDDVDYEDTYNIIKCIIEKIYDELDDTNTTEQRRCLIYRHLYEIVTRIIKTHWKIKKYVDLF